MTDPEIASCYPVCEANCAFFYNGQVKLVYLLQEKQDQARKMCETQSSQKKSEKKRCITQALYHRTSLVSGDGLRYNPGTTVQIKLTLVQHQHIILDNKQNLRYFALIFKLGIFQWKFVLLFLFLFALEGSKQICSAKIICPSVWNLILLSLYLAKQVPRIVAFHILITLLYLYIVK